MNACATVQLSRGRTVKHVLASVCCALFGVGFAGSAIAQTPYPSKPIRLIVPFSPGGGVDLIARLVGQKLGERLGQSIIIDNRAGASTIIGTDAVAKVAPDGYTLLMASTSHTANISLFKKLPFDIHRDLIPVSLVANSPAILVVNPAVPAKSLTEFIQYAKSKPGALGYASFGKGSSPHLVTELFQDISGTKFLHVPYKGGGPAVLSTMAGETSMVIPSIVPVLTNLKDGKLRALAVASRQRLPLLPNVPTFREQGVSLETGTWFGVLAPAGTPPEVVRKLNHEIATLLSHKDVQQKLMAEGAESVGGSPQEFGAFLKAETERWKRVVQQADIQAE